MKDSWRYYLRRTAAVCVVSLATTWSSAVCYAVQLAYDTASDVAYNDGWQAGDNGGFGFGGWDFSGTYSTLPPNQQAIDDGTKAGATGSSPYNDIGRSWTLFNANGRNQGPVNSPVGGTDIARAGRAIPGNLQVGQTVRMVIDNPTERFFFRGYTIQFNHGGASACYSGDNCTTPTYDPGSVNSRMRIGTFEYFTYGQWYATGAVPQLHDTDTDAGMRIEFTLTGANAYSLNMIPLDNPGNTYTNSGTLAGTGAIDWIEIQFYNTDSDFYPSLVAGTPPPLPGDYNGNGKVDAADYVLWRKGGTLQNEVDNPGTVNGADYTAWRARYGNTSTAAQATDFYISSMEIVSAGSGTTLVGGSVPEPHTFVLTIAGLSAALSCRARRP